MKKSEAKFQTIFNQYLRKKRLFGYFELKETSGSSLPFSAVKEHQVEGLLAAGSSGFVWKLSDEDSREKPFDCIHTGIQMPYVVIKYPKTFYVITIYNFMKEKESSKRKSLTEWRARNICSYEVKLSP